MSYDGAMRQPRGDAKGDDDRGAVVAFPGSREAERPPDNLPLELSSFVGREREIAGVKELLAGHRRLLTLTGPGGSGKTRLALEVAGDLVGDYPDGVWLAELAPLSDPDLVPRAVASVLDVTGQPGRPLTDALVDSLGTRRLLLVLDNCEHLIEAVARFAETLLKSCPHLRILATSRETLSVAGETGLRVPSLSVPDPDAAPAVEDLSGYEAVGLFVERARARLSTFALTSGNAGTVAEVCRRLEGIPLAIELAAARVGTLAVEQILDRLEDSLRLLTGGGRMAAPRQRTLRGALDWSYDLLGEREKELFGRLSVFAGGWSLEAAEAVGVEPGSGIEEGEVLDLLGGLVDKSLVAAETGSEDALRYRMLEPVRQYGREKLEEGGEAGEARRRHAGWFLALAEDAEPHLKGRRQVAWLERLEREHDNLRAAMRWFLEEGEAEPAVRFAWALWFFWYLHGHQGEGYRYTGEILDRGAALPPAARAKALCVRAITSYGLESIERTMLLWEESVALFRPAGDKSGLAISVGGVGLAALQQGDTERATKLFEEALQLYREVGDQWGASSILAHLGIIPLGKGDHARAVGYFEEGLAISREIGDRLVGYISLYNLALASRARGDHERAAGLYAEGLGLALEVSDKANAAYCLEGLAGLLAEKGDPERAARLFGASEALLEAVGAPLYVQAQDRATYERAVDAVRSRLPEAQWDAAWAEGRAMTLELAGEYALQPPSAPEEPTLPPAYPAGLSAREVEVLKLVARGMTNAQVAKHLFISQRTVNVHMGSVYNKLGFNTRAEATRFAVEHGLL